MHCLLVIYLLHIFWQNDRLSKHGLVDKEDIGNYIFQRDMKVVERHKLFYLNLHINPMDMKFEMLELDHPGKLRECYRKGNTAKVLEYILVI